MIRVEIKTIGIMKWESDRQQLKCDRPGICRANGSELVLPADMIPVEEPLHMMVLQPDLILLPTYKQVISAIKK